MQVRDLIDAFAGVDELWSIRKTERLAEIAAKLPVEPEAYLELSKQYYTRLNGYLDFLEEEPLFEEAKRLRAIFRELYYFDFRTLEAILFQCDLALDDKTDSGFGTGQLAAIMSSMPPKDLRGYSDDALLRRMETYLASPAMEHNARGVIQKVLRRNPEMRRARGIKW